MKVVRAIAFVGPEFVIKPDDNFMTTMERVYTTAPPSCQYAVIEDGARIRVVDLYASGIAINTIEGVQAHYAFDDLGFTDADQAIAAIQVMGLFRDHRPLKRPILSINKDIIYERINHG